MGKYVIKSYIISHLYRPYNLWIEIPFSKWSPFTVANCSEKNSGYCEPTWYHTRRWCLSSCFPQDLHLRVNGSHEKPQMFGFRKSMYQGQRFWLQIQRSRVRSPALPDFLSSSGSGTGSTQPREVKLRS